MMANDRLNWTPRAFSLVAINSFFIQFNNNRKRVHAYATSRINIRCILHSAIYCQMNRHSDLVRNHKITQKVTLTIFPCSFFLFCNKKGVSFQFLKSIEYKIKMPCKFIAELWFLFILHYFLYKQCLNAYGKKVKHF